MLEVTIRCARLKLWSISASTVSVLVGHRVCVLLPCNVSVMDCSSFSSSSVKVKPLGCTVELVRDMLNWSMGVLFDSPGRRSQTRERKGNDAPSCGFRGLAWCGEGSADLAPI